MLKRVLRLILLVSVTSVLWVPAALATPQFARKYDLRCTACHTVPPMLSPEGLAFQMTAYLPPPTTIATCGPSLQISTILSAIDSRAEPSMPN